MEDIAKFLQQKPRPGFIPVLIPMGGQLAQMLEESASLLRNGAAVSRNNPGLIKVSRIKRDRLRQAFTSMLSNDLRGLTGEWFDEETAVLAEIALDVRDITVEQVRWARQPRARRAKPRRVHKRKGSSKPKKSRHTSG